MKHPAIAHDGAADIESNSDVGLWQNPGLLNRSSGVDVATGLNGTSRLESTAAVHASPASDKCRTSNYASGIHIRIVTEPYSLSDFSSRRLEPGSSSKSVPYELHEICRRTQAVDVARIEKALPPSDESRERLAVASLSPHGFSADDCNIQGTIFAVGFAHKRPLLEVKANEVAEIKVGVGPRAYQKQEFHLLPDPIGDGLLPSRTRILGARRIGEGRPAETRLWNDDRGVPDSHSI